MSRLINTNVQMLKTIAMLAALALLVAGVVMVFSGIRDEGFIDIRATFLEGKLKTGLVGVTLIFFAVLVIVACFVFRYKEPIEIQVGDVSLKSTGGVSPERLKALVGELVELSRASKREERGSDEADDP